MPAPQKRVPAASTDLKPPVVHTVVDSKVRKADGDGSGGAATIGPTFPWWNSTNDCAARPQFLIWLRSSRTRRTHQSAGCRARAWTPRDGSERKTKSMSRRYPPASGKRAPSPALRSKATSSAMAAGWSDDLKSHEGQCAPYLRPSVTATGFTGGQDGRQRAATTAFGSWSPPSATAHATTCTRRG